MDANPKIQKLKKKMEQLDARLKLEEAKEKTRQKKQDTRRKILLGALLMEWMDQDKITQLKAYEKLETFLVRKIDRDLFDLGDVQQSRSREGPVMEKNEKTQKPKDAGEKPRQETAKAQKTA